MFQKAAMVLHLKARSRFLDARFIIPLLCILFNGCGRSIDYLEPGDPALIKKLEISEQDWEGIKLLSSERKEFVILRVGKAGPGLIEVEFKKPDDRQNDEGGPIDRYEKYNGMWRKQDDFMGNWAVAHTK